MARTFLPPPSSHTGMQSSGTRAIVGHNNHGLRRFVFRGGDGGGDGGSGSRGGISGVALGQGGGTEGRRGGGEDKKKRKKKYEEDTEKDDWYAMMHKIRAVPERPQHNVSYGRKD